MPNLPASLSPPVRTLLGPGPSDVHPRVLAAMARPTVGHLDPFYLQAMDEMQAMLREVYRTKNEMTLAISGTGSAGQEAVVQNMVEPGDRVLIAINGVFGGRLKDMAERAGAEVHTIERPWGEVFTHDEIAEAIERVKPASFGIVMAETSTGAHQPIEGLGQICHDAGALLMVDAVTALGGVPVEVDAWEIDAIYSGTQKCLSCPPGLAPVSFSERAMDKIRGRKEKCRSWYLDISMIANYWGGDRAYHHTAPINMTYGLHEALRIVLEEGLDACFARHRLNHQALKAGLTALGIDYVTDADHILPQLNAVRPPAGVDEAAVRRQLLERFGVEVGAGLGPFKGQAWRIGPMGYASRASNVLLVLSALDQLIGPSTGTEPGASVAAANEAYRGGSAT